MPFIAFLGCDGSGKSAVIRGVTEQLQARGIAVTLGHWRPKAIAISGSSETPIAADDPHGLPPRGFLSSILKLGWLWLNWWIGWFRDLRAASRAGVVLFDRYHADLLIDPRRYRYGGPMWLAKLASQLMPQPDLVVFLDAPAEVLLSRKQEVPIKSLEKSRDLYSALAAKNPRICIIDASRPIAKVINDTASLIRREK
jgi:thymidylate kinase